MANFPNGLTIALQAGGRVRQIDEVTGHVVKIFWENGDVFAVGRRDNTFDAGSVPVPGPVSAPESTGL